MPPSVSDYHATILTGAWASLVFFHGFFKQYLGLLGINTTEWRIGEANDNWLNIERLTMGLLSWMKFVESREFGGDIPSKLKLGQTIFEEIILTLHLLVPE